jgi:hypothetical protein
MPGLTVSWAYISPVCVPGRAIQNPSPQWPNGHQGEVWPGLVGGWVASLDARNAKGQLVRLALSQWTFRPRCTLVPRAYARVKRCYTRNPLPCICPRKYDSTALRSLLNFVCPQPNRSAFTLIDPPCQYSTFTNPRS